MPSEMREFFTAAKGLTPKAACAEYTYNYLMDLKEYQLYSILNTIKYIYYMIMIVF